jgi:hypothetical protein
LPNRQVDVSVWVVIDKAPTQGEAQAALAEADTQAALVRREDHEFRWLLLVVAAIYLLGAGVVSLSPTRRGGPIAGLALVIIVAAGIAGLIWVGIRIRAYSRRGVLWFALAIAAFIVWNSMVTGVSVVTGWWAPNQPSYHFGVSELVGVIPLVVAAWLIGRR